MKRQIDKSKENKSPSTVNETVGIFGQGESIFQFKDNRPESKSVAGLQALANEYTSNIHNPIQKKKNDTGLPDKLKAGIENLSGHSLDDVNVHYNSPKPSQLQAHAYAQGSDIHLAPGQEKHLPHEAWHVVQQKQGRVKATRQLKAHQINDDAHLEKEANTVGDLFVKQGLDTLQTKTIQDQPTVSKSMDGNSKLIEKSMSNMPMQMAFVEDDKLGQDLGGKVDVQLVALVKIIEALNGIDKDPTPEEYKVEVPKLYEIQNTIRTLLVNAKEGAQEPLKGKILGAMEAIMYPFGQLLKNARQVIAKMGKGTSWEDLTDEYQLVFDVEGHTAKSKPPKNERPTQFSNLMLQNTGFQALQTAGVATGTLHAIANNMEPIKTDQFVLSFVGVLERLAGINAWSFVKQDGIQKFFDGKKNEKVNTTYKGAYPELNELYRIIHSGALKAGTQITFGKDKERPKVVGMVKNAKDTQDVDIAFHGSDNKRHFHEVKADPITLVNKVKSIKGRTDRKPPKKKETKKVKAGEETNPNVNVSDQILSYDSLMTDRTKTKRNIGGFGRPSYGKRKHQGYVVVFVVPSDQDWVFIFTSGAAKDIIKYKFSLRLKDRMYTHEELEKINRKLFTDISRAGSNIISELEPSPWTKKTSLAKKPTDYL